MFIFNGKHSTTTKLPLVYIYQIQLQRETHVCMNCPNKPHSPLPQAPDMPGLRGNLVDSSGFPRSDIDIHNIRSQRQRFTILKTDHTKISAQMEQQLHLALAPPDNLVSSSSPQPPSASRAATTQVTQSGSSSMRPPETVVVPPRAAFALVDVVAPNSPAEQDGLLAGDTILSFGNISLRSFATPALAMERLPLLVQENVNLKIDVDVRRGEPGCTTELTVSLTPRKWGGRGLIGCHTIPLVVKQEDDRYRPDVATATQSRSLSHN